MATGPVGISVITATLNAAEVIGRLGADLVAQTDADFTWIVVDGGSTDGTPACLPAALSGRTVLVREPDFGIYDALNKGLDRCTTSHYLVAGADDRLAHDAVAEYRRLAADNDADIVAASVRDGTGLAHPARGRPWLWGQGAYLSHHSVGTLFRRSLHERVGRYSNALPIAADQLFVKRAIQSGARIHYAPGFVAGEFTRGGVSSRRYAQLQFEFALVQLRTERARSLQLALFVLRLLRHWRRFVAQDGK